MRSHAEKERDNFSTKPGIDLSQEADLEHTGTREGKRSKRKGKGRKEKVRIRRDGSDLCLPQRIGYEEADEGANGT